MAYTDYAFYAETYGGTKLAECEAQKWLEMASDEVDTLTMHRLQAGMPADTYFATRIQ